MGQNFGWDRTPGTNFELHKEKDSIKVKSLGAGHGVGLCQWGARGLALQGKNYLQILQFYFPNTTILQKQKTIPYLYIPKVK